MKCLVSSVGTIPSLLDSVVGLALVVLIVVVRAIAIAVVLLLIVIISFASLGVLTSGYSILSWISLCPPLALGQEVSL